MNPKIRLIGRLLGGFLLLRALVLLTVVGAPMVFFLLIMGTDSGIHAGYWRMAAIILGAYALAWLALFWLAGTALAPRWTAVVLPAWLRRRRLPAAVFHLMIVGYTAFLAWNAWQNHQEKVEVVLAQPIGCLPSPARAIPLSRDTLVNADMKASRATLYWHMALAEGRGLDENGATDTGGIDQRSAGESLARAARAGSPDAQYWLGWAYAHGDCASRNADAARHWLEKAAAAGDARATQELAGLGG